MFLNRREPTHNDAAHELFTLLNGKFALILLLTVFLCFHLLLSLIFDYVVILLLDLDFNGILILFLLMIIIVEALKSSQVIDVLLLIPFLPLSLLS